jgi:hypothetical protein
VRDDSTAAQPTDAVRLLDTLLLPHPPATRGDVRLSGAHSMPHTAAGVHSDMLTYVDEACTLTAEELRALRHPLVVFWVNERLSAKTLAQLARQVPGICVTEAQLKRAASLAGLIDAARRARLTNRAPQCRDHR